MKQGQSTWLPVYVSALILQVLVNLITNAIKFTAKKNGERSITVSMGASLERPTSYPPNVIFFTREDQETKFHIDSTMTSDWGNAPVVYIMVAVKTLGSVSAKRTKRSSLKGFAKRHRKLKRVMVDPVWVYLSHANVRASILFSLYEYGSPYPVCQLHGGDIGVSSKEGEGSTFGFFFKARYSKDANEGTRPPVGIRSNSDSPRPTTPINRPSYSRANSAAYGIREQSVSSSHLPERPKPHPVSSYGGISTEDMNESLNNPPTERNTEVSPDVNKDSRFEETKEIFDEMDVGEHVGGHKLSLPDLSKGETNRQESNTEQVSKSKRGERSSGARNTVLLVEDNLINQKVLRRQLHSKGFEVCTPFSVFFSSESRRRRSRIPLTLRPPGFCRQQRPRSHRCCRRTW